LVFSATFFAASHSSLNFAISSVSASFSLYMSLNSPSSTISLPLALSSYHSDWNISKLLVMLFLSRKLRMKSSITSTFSDSLGWCSSTFLDFEVVAFIRLSKSSMSFKSCSSSGILISSNSSKFISSPSS